MPGCQACRWYEEETGRDDFCDPCPDEEFPMDREAWTGCYYYRQWTGESPRQPRRGRRARSTYGRGLCIARHAPNCARVCPCRGEPTRRVVATSADIYRDFARTVVNDTTPRLTQMDFNAALDAVVEREREAREAEAEEAATERRLREQDATERRQRFVLRENRRRQAWFNPNTAEHWFGQSAVPSTDEAESSEEES